MREEQKKNDALVGAMAGGMGGALISSIIGFATGSMIDMTREEAIAHVYNCCYFACQRPIATLCESYSQAVGNLLFQCAQQLSRENLTSLCEQAISAGPYNYAMGGLGIGVGVGAVVGGLAGGFFISKFKNREDTGDGENSVNETTPLIRN